MWTAKKNNYTKKKKHPELLIPKAKQALLLGFQTFSPMLEPACRELDLFSHNRHIREDKH